MKLLIIGAAGGVGRLLVAQALPAGHEVTGLPPKNGGEKDYVSQNS